MDYMELLKDFVIYGTILNLISLVVLVVVLSLKLSSFGKEATEGYRIFSAKKHEFVKKNVTPEKIWLHLLTMLIPTYSAWINSILIYHALFSRNLADLIQGIKTANQYKFFRIINYNIKKI